MLLKDINPFVRFARLCSLNPGVKEFTFMTMNTPDCRMFVITSGSADIIIHSDTFHVKAHDAILFHAGTKYQWRPDRKYGVSYYAVNFDYTHNFSHFKEPFDPLYIGLESGYSPFEKIHFEDADCLNQPIVIKNALSIEDILRTIVIEASINNEFCSELLGSLLKSAIISTVRQCYDQNKYSDKDTPFEIRYMIDFIQKHYQEDISNERMAEEFNFNPSYLSRKFKKYMGVSLHAFILNYRINMAVLMLRTQSICVSELSTAVGFTDIYHFSKCFKKVIGISPTEFKKQYKG